MSIHEQIRYEITYILEYLGIPVNLFGYFLVFLIFIIIYKKGKNIDKKEKLLKIMFSEKYDKQFGGNAGHIKRRHIYILEYFGFLFASIIAFIMLLIYLYNMLIN